MTTTWDRDRFDRAYQQFDETRQTHVPSYRRARLGQSEVWDDMVAAYRMVTPPGGRILIVGCGFGWTVERLVDLGYDAHGADTSPWINSAKLSEARRDIRDRIRPIDIMSPAATSLGTFDLVATELVVDSIPEDDLPAFLDACEALSSGSVAHLVAPAPPAAPDPDLGLRVLPFPDWIRQRGSHIWIRNPNPGEGRAYRVRLPNGQIGAARR